MKTWKFIHPTCSWYFTHLLLLSTPTKIFHLSHLSPSKNPTLDAPVWCDPWRGSLPTFAQVVYNKKQDASLGALGRTPFFLSHQTLEYTVVFKQISDDISRRPSKLNMMNCCNILKLSYTSPQNYRITNRKFGFLITAQSQVPEL